MKKRKVKVFAVYCNYVHGEYGDIIPYDKRISQSSDWESVTEEEFELLKKWCKKHTAYNYATGEPPDVDYIVVEKVDASPKIMIKEALDDIKQEEVKKKEQKKIAAEKRKKREDKKKQKEEKKELKLLADLNKKYENKPL